jgi:hypothetical protein
MRGFLPYSGTAGGAKDSEPWQVARKGEVAVDLGDMLAADAAQEIVKAIAAGVTEVAKRIPVLWRRAGGRKEELIKSEVERSVQALRDAAGDLTAILVRQEGAWEGRLRDLLAEYPEAAADIRRVTEDLGHLSAHAPRITQSITASAPGAIAQGAMFGSIVNHHNLSETDGRADESVLGFGVAARDSGT